MEFISDHITLAEATYSPKAIALGYKNTPGAEELKNMKLLATNVYEPLRAGLGNHPLKINSFFRSELLNQAIGGANGSQHVQGQAIDLDGLSCTNANIFHYIKENLVFDKLIWEFGTNKNPDWVHVSYNSNGNRKQILVGTKVKGKTIYKTYSNAK
ncbi:MAG: hypothetical protein H7296_07445 [Bacteroidia bacterium]|nr:hypothetical protein [Bacteroidia bacterium]